MTSFLKQKIEVVSCGVEYNRQSLFSCNTILFKIIHIILELLEINSIREKFNFMLTKQP